MSNDTQVIKNTEVEGRAFVSVSLLAKLGVVSNKNAFFKKVNGVHRVWVISPEMLETIVHYADLTEQEVVDWVKSTNQVTLSELDQEEFNKVGYLQLVSSESIAGKIKVV